MKAKILMTLRTVMTAVLVIAMVRSQMGVKESRTPMETVKAQVMSAAESLDGTQEDSRQMLKKLYGLDSAEYEDICFVDAVSGMDVQEILIVRLKSAEQSDQVKAAMEQRIESQIRVFEGYGVEQTALLKEAVVDVQGNYVLLAVHKDAKQMDRAFRECL